MNKEPYFNPMDPFGEKMKVYSKEQQIKQIIRMGEDRGFYRSMKVDYDGEYIDAWIIFGCQMVESEMNEEEINYSEAFQKSAFRQIHEENPYLVELTLVHCDINKQHNPERFEYVYRAEFVYCRPELMFLKEEKPHLFI